MVTFLFETLLLALLKPFVYSKLSKIVLLIFLTISVRFSLVKQTFIQFKMHKNNSLNAFSMAFYAELLLFLSKTQFVFPAANIQTLLVELF